MSYRETEHLRVLIANERRDRLALVAPVVANLGHEVIAREIDVADVGVVTATEQPDVALVGLGKSSEHALAMIGEIVQEAACPVILLMHAPDPAFVKEASKRGIFACITDADVDDWQSAIDIVLRRFTEYHDLEGAFGRRAVTERAKGILMERHSVDEATPSRCCATNRAGPTPSSLMSRPPSSTAIGFCRSSRTSPLSRPPVTWRDAVEDGAIDRRPGDSVVALFKHGAASTGRATKPSKSPGCRSSARRAFAYAAVGGSSSPASNSQTLAKSTKLCLSAQSAPRSRSVNAWRAPDPKLGRVRFRGKPSWLESPFNRL